MYCLSQYRIRFFFCSAERGDVPRWNSLPLLRGCCPSSPSSGTQWTLSALFSECLGGVHSTEPAREFNPRGYTQSFQPILCSDQSFNYLADSCCAVSCCIYTGDVRGIFTFPTHTVSARVWAVGLSGALPLQWVWEK